MPLLEKAFAKAHGDYSSIDGGFVGEAIEDLTGGVTTEFFSTDILDKDKFWREELLNVNEDFLFGCATGLFSGWLDPHYSGPPRERRGITERHAYSIMDAKEVKGHRLLKVRNPWGKKEWSGAWSDGSEEWDAEWLQLLGHKFGMCFFLGCCGVHWYCFYYIGPSKLRFHELTLPAQKPLKQTITQTC